MKKKSIGLLTVTMLLCAGLIAGCGSDNDKQAQAPAQETQGGSAAEETAAQVFAVTFYDSDGTTVLSTQEVASGGTAAEYVPEKDNEIFMGWFGTPTLAHAYDFSQPVTADTKVFAGFLIDVEDTRSFAVVGSGKSTLLAKSSWGEVIEQGHRMQKTGGKNEYTITLDLFQGDEFQLAIDTTWANQRGAGYLTTVQYDGKNYFAGSGSLSKETQKSNIKCLVDGNYTLTLTTYPGADIYNTEDSLYTEETREKFNTNPYDTITFVYNGEAKEAPAESVTTYYIKGAKITNWEDNYDEKYAFTEDNGIHTLVIALEEGDEFLFTTLVTTQGTTGVGNEYVRYSNIKDTASQELLDSSGSYNMIVKKNGTYTFTYDPAAAELTVSVK